MPSIASRILAANDLIEQEITIPEWDNVTVIMRAMTAQQRAEFARTQAAGPQKAMASVIIACMLDPESKKPVFEAAHRDELLSKNGQVVESLFMVLADISGMDRAAWSKIEKNSQTAGNGDSTSPSPNSSIVQ